MVACYIFVILGTGACIVALAVLDPRWWEPAKSLCDAATILAGGTYIPSSRFSGPSRLLGVIGMASSTYGTVGYSVALRTSTGFQNPFRRPVATAIFMIWHLHHHLVV